MKTGFISLLIVLLCGLPYSLTAQQKHPLNSPDNLYENGRQLFLQGEYAPAQQALTKFINNTPSSDFVAEAEYMLACMSYELKEKDCADLMRDYLEKYPDSPYKNRVYALIASAYYFDGKYDDAIAMFNASELYQLGDEERDASTYRLALSYMEINHPHEAAVWFKTLLATSPEYYADARYNLAYIDYTLGNYDEALPVFLNMQDAGKYRELVPYYIAEIYLVKKNYDKSEIVAEGYISSYPRNANVPEMERILGISRYYMGKASEAIEPLTAYVNGVDNPKRDALYLLGMACYQARIYSRAAEMLGKVTTVDDALSQNAYLHMGLSYLQLQDKGRARMAFEQAASMTYDQQVKEQALYNYAVGIHETSYSPFDESVTVFERILNEFPNSQYAGKVSDYLVEVYMNTRSYEAALKSIAKISHPGARILEAKQKILFQLGTQSFANANFNEAIDYFNQSLELSRYNVQTKAEAHYWKGEAYYRLGRYADASRDLRQYLEFTRVKNNDMYGLAHYTLGYISFKQKDYTRARNWFGDYTRMAVQDQNVVLADAYNRMGDCYFYVRQFAEAQQNYARAVQLDASQGDYSLYQEAFVLGLQKDYLGKIHVLNKLIDQYPSSQYQDDAMYERGRAYVMLEDQSRAINSFRELLTKFPESAMARKGANEIGLLYYQNDNYSEAIQAYKHVINTYPGSEEARLAQRDLKSIYIDLNKVDEYAEFASSIPGGATFDVSERDSLTYIAAEKIYMRGDIQEAKSSFTRYLQSFPEGAYSLNTYYYLGLIDYNQKNFTAALANLEKVLAFPDNKFSEEAMVMSAEILFNSRNTERALAVYKQLRAKASSPERVLIAKTGILRSAYASLDQKEVINAATDLLSDAKLTPELVNEARYYRAKAYLDQNARKAAKEDLKALSKDTRNSYGAEAKYLLAQAYYDDGETQQAEKEVLDYIDKSTPHAYWLARSFILLSDVYMKMGRDLEAKQYLLSLQQNYQANDDIANMIETRLNKINQ